MRVWRSGTPAKSCRHLHGVVRPVIQLAAVAGGFDEHEAVWRDVVLADDSECLLGAHEALPSGLEGEDAAVALKRVFAMLEVRHGPLTLISGAHKATASSSATGCMSVTFFAFGSNSGTGARCRSRCSCQALIASANFWESAR